MNFTQYYEAEENDGEPESSEPRLVGAEQQFQTWVAMDQLGLLDRMKCEVAYDPISDQFSLQTAVEEAEAPGD
jgi:hypothetical protein